MALVNVHLTPAQFKDAVQKGLGRAILAVDGPVSDEFKEVIFEGRLFDMRYDNWQETGRAPFMMQLLERAGLTDEFLPLLLEPFTEEHEDRNKRLRKFMLAEFARLGHSRAWDALIEFAKVGNNVDYSALVDVGSVGVEWLVQNILPKLPMEDRWQIESWKEECPAPLSPAVMEILDNAIQEQEASRPEYKAPTVDRRPDTLDEILAKPSDARLSPNSIRMIAKFLSIEEVERVANLWLQEQDQRRARTYTRLFKARDFPFPFQVIIDRFTAGDPPLDFEDVLEHSTDPVVRQFGLELIRKDEPDYRGYKILIRSFQDEDIPFIVKSLEKFIGGDKDDLHDIVFALRGMSERLSVSQRIPFLTWVYEFSPCAFCRNIVAETMLEDGTLPDAYRHEMAFDAQTDTRALVTSPS